METKQENKKATVFAILFVTSTILLIITGYAGYMQYERNEDLVAKFTKEEFLMRSQFAEEFAQIEENLTEISAHELVLRNSIRNPETEVPFQQSTRIQNEILLIQSLLDQNNAMILQLQKDLGTKDEQLLSYQSRVRSLEKKIAQYQEDLDSYFLENEELKVDLAQTETERQVLSSVVTEQSIQLADQEENLTAKSEKIDELDREKNTVYFVVGEMDDLKEKGIIQPDASFLGIGMSQQISLPADKTKFTSVDKRDYTLIPVFTKKLSLITTHDPSSYEYVISDGTIKWIKINDVNKFWDGSDYLIVATRDGIDLTLAPQDINPFNQK